MTLQRIRSRLVMCEYQSVILGHECVRCWIGRCPCMCVRVNVGNAANMLMSAPRTETKLTTAANTTEMEFAIHFECTSDSFLMFRILYFERNYGGE